MIAIVDYGMGNLRSVQKACESIGISALISDDKNKIMECRGIILPGVGAFPDAMDNIVNRGIDEILYNAAKKDIPILGICLGMQLLFEEGEEVRRCKGLGLLKGRTKKIQGEVKVPHMGWNNLNFKEECTLLKGIEDNSYVYFVHSYYVDMMNKEDLNASTYYGGEVPAVVSHNNVYGMQFHPEKSGEVGIKMLKNFGGLIK